MLNFSRFMIPYVISQVCLSHLAHQAIHNRERESIASQYNKFSETTGCSAESQSIMSWIKVTKGDERWGEKWNNWKGMRIYHPRVWAQQRGDNETTIFRAARNLHIHNFMNFPHSFFLFPHLSTHSIHSAGKKEKGEMSTTSQLCGDNKSPNSQSHVMFEPAERKSHEDFLSRSHVCAVRCFIKFIWWKIDENHDEMMTMWWMRIIWFRLECV